MHMNTVTSEKKQTLIFDVWGDFAHFKQNFATTSAITFSFPPRNTLAGLIGAILGIKRNEFPKILSPDECDLALSIKSDVKKITMKINLVNSKALVNERFLNYFKQHTQIPFQFLVNPKYRVYFSCTDLNLFDKLKENIKFHKSYYTPALGLSNLICDFRYVKEMSLDKVLTEKEVRITSVIPLSNIKELNIETNKVIRTENVPRFINSERETLEYQNVILSPLANDILNIIPKNEVWRTKKDEHICFL